MGQPVWGIQIIETIGRSGDPNPHRIPGSHKADLLSVTDSETEIKLFKEAVNKSLPVRDLRDRVAQVRGLLPAGETKQVDAGKTKAIDFEKLLQKPIFSDTEKLRGLTGARRKKLQGKVEEAYTRLTRLLDEYAKLRTLLSEIETSGVE